MVTGTYLAKITTWFSKDDLHNLRAANVDVNGDRSNYPFTENNKPYTGSNPYQLLGSGWYPGDEHIGDVARIVLYISIRYKLSLSSVSNLNMFLTWHELDPVNEFEKTRNDRSYTIQKIEIHLLIIRTSRDMFWCTKDFLCYFKHIN